jgi:hypothetical protein
MTTTNAKTVCCPCCDRSIKIVESKTWGRQVAKHGYRSHNAQLTDGCPGSYLKADSLLSSAIEKAQYFIDWAETTDEAREKFWRPMLAKLEKQLG